MNKHSRSLEIDNVVDNNIGKETLGKMVLHVNLGVSSKLDFI